MARPEKDSCDFFFTSTKLLYDTKIKALRRSFKATGNANNAFFVFDYLFREIFGNEGYYIRYTEDLVGDTADFCYVTESFVSDVIQKCLDIELFHKGQFEENGILTSKAIQKKYGAITSRRAKKSIESRFCVLDEELMSAETELMSAESTHSKRIEKKSKGIGKKSEIPPKFLIRIRKFLRKYPTRPPTVRRKRRNCRENMPSRESPPMKSETTLTRS